MIDSPEMKLLFIINRKSGQNSSDWPLLISEHFKSENIVLEILELDEECSKDSVKEKIDAFKPTRAVAVGGDGTVKLVAECLLDTNIPLGIIPAGSANGMAKELGIPVDPTKAFNVVTNGETKNIHLIKINDELCIHLSDIGFNAFVIKKFETENSRGMWGYIKAAWKVLWQQPHMQVQVKIDGEFTKLTAAMIVIANATKYGSGALINPEGKLDDEFFEVIVVRKISFAEIFKMMVTHLAFDPAKTKVYQTTSLNIKSRRKAHFQVDGEYLGKVNEINASILPGALELIVPTTDA